VTYCDPLLSLSLSLVLRCIAILLHFGIETSLLACRRFFIYSAKQNKNLRIADAKLYAELVNCPIIHTIEPLKNLNGQCSTSKQGGMPVGRGGYGIQQGHVNPAFIQSQNDGYDGGATKRFRPDDG